MEQDTITIRDKVNQYVIEHTFADKHKIQNDSLIFREGFFDSMGFIMLITFIEEQFSIRINDDELVEENFESINAITDFIVRKKSN